MTWPNEIPAGWTLGNIEPSERDGDDWRGQRIRCGGHWRQRDAGGGAERHAHVYEYQAGELIIVKDAEPNDAQDFKFDPSATAGDQLRAGRRCGRDD